MCTIDFADLRGETQLTVQVDLLPRAAQHGKFRSSAVKLTEN